MHRSKKIVLAALAACALPALAATPIQLKFEGLSVTTSVGGVASTRDVSVDTYYNGGSSKSTDAAGSPVQTGPSLGVVFGGNAIATASSDTGGDLGTFNKQRSLVMGGASNKSDALGTGALYAKGDINKETSFTIEVAGGFNDGLSFFYNASGNVEVSIRNAADVELKGFTFPSVIPGLKECTEFGNNRCIWAEAELAFLGDATKVVFSGLSFDFLLDNITLGSLDALNASAPAPAVPEPSTYALMLLGLAAVGFSATRRRKNGR